VTGKINIGGLLRTFVSLSVIAASAVFSIPSAAAAVPCSERILTVVAHEDDDLLFMNPDIQHDLSAGACATTVFLTAGDDGQPSAYWLEREMGSQSAYDTMLAAKGPSTWTVSPRSFAGHSVHTATRSDGLADLIYLRLPDGGQGGEGFSATGNQSLSQLYGGSISSMTPVDGTPAYSRADLIATIAAIVTATGPSVIRVQDGRVGQNDHPDHQMAALFTLDALIGYTSTVTAYRGYGVTDEVANVSGTDLTLKTNALLSDAAHDPLLCNDLSNCPTGLTAQWNERQYNAPLPFSLTPVAGPAPYAGPDVARNASVVATSQLPGQEATKAIDSVVSGYPVNAAAEWSSDGQGSGAWIQLYWSAAQTIDRVYLYDRPNAADQVTGGTLTFSDGSSVTVPPLNNDGSATIVTFAPRSVTTLRFTVTSVSATTSNVGLAELEAYNGEPAVTAGQVAISGTVAVGSTVTATPSGWAPDDVVLSFEWRRNGSAIDQATWSTYVPTLADVGLPLAVAVTGSRDGWVPATVVIPITADLPQPKVTVGTVSITGSATVGSTLTAGTAGWSPDGLSYTYQWRSDGSDILGANGATYVPITADIDHALSVAATGTLAGYISDTGVSASTAKVVAKPAVTAGSVSISGTAGVGSTLTASSSNWQPSGVVVAYQWRRSGTDISGATGATYVPGLADVGSTLTVMGTGTLTGWVSATAESAPTVTVPQPSVTAGAVSIGGTAIMGSTLTAATSGWAPDGLSFTYQWRRDGNDILGATVGTYVATPADVGHTLSVVVMGAKTGYISAGPVSAATAVVQPKQIVAGAPSVTGTAAVSGTLTASPGVWAPSDATLAYQWRRDANPIAGATTSMYTPSSADVGHTLAVAVTGTKDGYAPATAVSPATAAIQIATSELAYEAFVKASYVDFLGRMPSAGEVAFQATALAQGRVTKAQYLESLSKSDEWLTTIVTKMYADTLHRTPDPAGLADWVSWIRSGRFTVAETAARFYSSDEYYSQFAGNSPASWVTQLYQKLLNRQPDAGGLSFWIANTSKYGRDWVAYNFYQSQETRMLRVEVMYRTLLNREPDAVGLPFWTARVLTTGDLALAWEIANSDEYWEKAHVRY